MRKKFVKSLILALITVAVLAGLNFVASPAWTDANDNSGGIYTEPHNTLQTLFLGTSQVPYAVSPDILYEDYGICAYDIGSGRMTMLAAYYWLKEIHSLHQDTLNTVVVDASDLFAKDTLDDPRVVADEKAIANMRVSFNKIEALKACAEQYEDFDVWGSVFPLTRYHARWTSLARIDFEGIGDIVNLYLRGQALSFKRSINYISYALVPDYSITPDLDYSPDEYEEVWNEAAKEYLERIAEYCVENELNLVLLKIPKEGIGDLENDSITYLAKEYNAGLINLSYPELQEELGLVFPIDYGDARHANVYGAEKITAYIGAYLKSHYELEDVRDNERYEFLKKQNSQFSVVREAVALSECTDLMEYLDLIDCERYSVFIAVRDEAAENLSEKARERLGDLGLAGLSELKHRCSYIGLLDQGRVVLDETAENEKVRLYADGMFTEFERNVRDLYMEETDESGNISKEIALQDGDGYYSIRSAGFGAGSLSSIKINGTEYSKSRRGLNFVVYDHELECVVDACTFDTYVPEEKRVSDTDLPHEYEIAVCASKLDAEQSAIGDIRIAQQEEHAVIVIVNPTDNEAVQLDVAVAEGLTDSGFTEAEGLGAHVLMAAAIGENVVAQQIGDVAQNLTLDTLDVGVLACTAYKKSDDSTAHITIGTTDYSVPAGTIGVMACDRATGTVVWFKTYSYS